MAGRVQRANLIIRTDSSHDALALVEDQSVHVVCEVGERQFGLCPGDPDRADNRPNRFFWWAKTCSIRARTDDFFALALAIAAGIGLPAGLRRWIWLRSILPASHFSLLWDR